MKKEDINMIEEENVNETMTNETDVNEETATKSEAPVDKTEDKQEEKAEKVDPLEAAKAEIEQLKTQALYKQAEFDNYRKRMKQQVADLILNGGEKTIIAILPILDDMERALQDKSTDPEAIREGMKLIFNKLVNTLEKMGAKKIETENADFNVDFHEAIAHVPGMGEDKKNKVIDCVQTGYTLNDKVIRYAKVAVGQ